jgi:cation:H+ antiporter
MLTNDILLTLASLALILLAANLFTNAVEWLGFKLKLGEGIVGSVLAAVGTAMPETIIPIVAISQDLIAGTLRTPEAHSQSVGVGAIIGAPFMLGTLGFALVGGAYLIFRKLGIRDDAFITDEEVFRHDMEFFMLAFGGGCAAGVLKYYWPGMPLWMDGALALWLIVMYFIYMTKLLKGTQVHADPGELHPLYITRFFFGPHHQPRKRFIGAQLFASLALMFYGAHLFVDHLGPIALALHVPALVLALLIVPVATELPEKFNSVIWIRRGKDTLALGNMSGAMVFQSTFPISLGLIFLDWRFSPTNPAVISAILGLIGAGIVYLGWRITGHVQPKLLAFSGLLYVVYIIIVILHQNGVIHLDVGALPVH